MFHVYGGENRRGSEGEERKIESKSSYTRNKSQTLFRFVLQCQIESELCPWVRGSRGQGAVRWKRGTGEGGRLTSTRHGNSGLAPVGCKLTDGQADSILN